MSSGADVAAALRRVRDLFGRVPRAAWICALIATMNAVCWSLITPPFQVPDEPAHFAYVQQVAETGSLPTSSGDEYSEEEEVALRDIRQLEVRFHPENHAVVTSAQQRRLQHDLAVALLRSGSGDAGVAASQPPLYYGLQTIPYLLGSGGTLLDRLELMRLLSALMAGFTALFVYLFVREALPRVPWAWPVGGLAVALSPLLGFMSGAVNPDALLFAASAAVFYFLARAFRRGLTTGLAVAIGVASAVGTLTKLNFLGLAPGIIVGLVVLGVRAPRASRRAVSRAAALAVVIAAAPSLVYVLVNVAGEHATLGSGSQALHPTGKHGSLFGEIGYIWQFYLPRVPGMAAEFPGVSTARLWFERSVGLYGWLDTPFPVWVTEIALIPTVLLTVLGIRALVADRAALRRRIVELAVYALMGLGLLALIAAASYVSLPAQTYLQPRYLLPLLPLLGAALALSARGAGNRWGPPVGALIVVLLLAHNVFSQLQVISRYYG
jgi:4-amino-4-deoxy-L-arabinose transferase-like glycosyltransferase